MEGELFQKVGFIAEIQNPAKVWVTYGEYTISESHLESGILHLRYENDIPIISRYSRIVVRWRYMLFMMLNYIWIISRHSKNVIMSCEQDGKESAYSLIIH